MSSISVGRVRQSFFNGVGPFVAVAVPLADPVEAMASALAVISGYTAGISAKSLLTSAEGFQTLLFKSDIPIKATQCVTTLGFLVCLLDCFTAHAKSA